jgi:hypothetical protein
VDMLTSFLTNKKPISITGGIHGPLKPLIAFTPLFEDIRAALSCMNLAEGRSDVVYHVVSSPHHKF